MDPFAAITNFLKGKSATIGEIQKAIDVEDLSDLLNGMVLMKKIGKSGYLYHDLNLEVSNLIEKTKAKKAVNEDEVEYPDYAHSAKEKIDYLIRHAPLLKTTQYFTYYEEEIVETGRELHDVLCSQVILHEVVVSPDSAAYSGSRKNVVTNNRTVSMGRGFGISFRDGKFRLFLATVKGNRELFFDDYSEVKKWLLKNL